MSEKAAGVPYDQRLARRLVPYLARLGVTPNQVTAFSLVLALFAAMLFASGETVLAHWGAGLFVLARVLDHFDGELARLTGQYSRFGYYFDYFAGTASYTALFVAIGVGLSQGPLGLWALLLSAVAALVALVTLPVNLNLDRLKEFEEGEAVGYPTFGGFELEDGIYLLAPITWLGWLAPFFVLVGLGAAAYGIWSCWCLWRARSAKQRPSGTSGARSGSAP